MWLLMKRKQFYLNHVTKLQTEVDFSWNNSAIVPPYAENRTEGRSGTENSTEGRSDWEQDWEHVWGLEQIWDWEQDWEQVWDGGQVWDWAGLGSVPGLWGGAAALNSPRSEDQISVFRPWRSSNQQSSLTSIRPPWSLSQCFCPWFRFCPSLRYSRCSRSVSRRVQAADHVTRLRALLSRWRAAVPALCWTPAAAARCAPPRRGSCAAGGERLRAAAAPGWSASKATRTRRTSWESASVRAATSCAEPTEWRTGAAVPWRAPAWQPRHRAKNPSTSRTRAAAPQVSQRHSKQQQQQQQCLQSDLNCDNCSKTIFTLRLNL